jgi:hypothetical protein
MDQKKQRQGSGSANPGDQHEFDRDQPDNPNQRDRSQADERSQGLRRKPESDDAAIPELAEPDVEGVGNEGGRHTEATMPPGEGQNPKRNTL